MLLQPTPKKLIIMKVEFRRGWCGLTGSCVVVHVAKRIRLYEIGFKHINGFVLWKTANMLSSGACTLNTLHMWQEWRRCESFPCHRSISGMHADRQRTIKPFSLLFKLCHKVSQRNSHQKKQLQLVAAASCPNHTSFLVVQTNQPEVALKVGLDLNQMYAGKGMNCITPGDRAAVLL